jgi:hypothetical protein
MQKSGFYPSSARAPLAACAIPQLTKVLAVINSMAHEITSAAGDLPASCCYKLQRTQYMPAAEKTAAFAATRTPLQRNRHE